jgi:hypothetical protein
VRPLVVDGVGVGAFDVDELGVVVEETEVVVDAVTVEETELVLAEELAVVDPALVALAAYTESLQLAPQKIDASPAHGMLQSVSAASMSAVNEFPQ